MQEFKGTPGPWVIDANGVQSRWNIDDKHGNTVALTQQLPNDKSREKRDANTQLIAAAPELLEALDKLVTEYIFTRSQLNGDEPDEMEDILCVKNARRAIAKALGK